MTDKNTSKPFMVTNTQARVIHTCGLSLKPGKLTEIPAEHVDALKKSPAYRARWIVEGEAKMPTPVIVPIEKLNVEQALKLIAVETDVNALSAWVESDKRPEVKAAILKRLNDL